MENISLSVQVGQKKKKNLQSDSATVNQNAVLCLIRKHFTPFVNTASALQSQDTSVA